MSAVDVPMFPDGERFSDPGTGKLTSAGWAWLSRMRDRTGGASDKVDSANELATNAVPQGTEVVASGGLRNGNSGAALGGNIGLTLYHSIDAAANLPTVAVHEGDWAYALDGRKPGEGSGAGTGVPCFWSNGVWNSVCSGAAVTT